MMQTSGTWILWLIFNLLYLLSTRNPVYLVIILIGYLISGYRLTRKNEPATWLKNNLSFLLTMVFLSTLINALFAHNGRTILFSLPKGWMLIGGNITLESVVYGTINGLIISDLYLLFTILNLALSPKQLTRLIPRVFYPIAMTVTIALTFFPSIQQRAREIKEAQMIRGNRMRNISDWLPLFIPLLVTSLEKAILLSESMTARGFHTPSRSEHKMLPFVGLLLTLFVLFSGWILRLFSYPLWISLMLYFFGGTLVLAVVLLSSHYSKITKYKKEVWHFSDIINTVILSIFIILWIVFTTRKALPSLSYSPYPTLLTPPFQVTVLLFSAVSLFPVFYLKHD
jgi:energy-coupling factor transport system permease protein